MRSADAYTVCHSCAAGIMLGRPRRWVLASSHFTDLARPLACPARTSGWKAPSQRHHGYLGGGGYELLAGTGVGLNKPAVLPAKPILFGGPTAVRAAPCIRTRRDSDVEAGSDARLDGNCFTCIPTAWPVAHYSQLFRRTRLGPSLSHLLAGRGPRRPKCATELWRKNDEDTRVRSDGPVRAKAG